MAKQTDLDECFQSVSEGKSLIAAAVTDKGVPTAADATFQTMANNILNLNTVTSDTYLYETFAVLSISTSYSNRYILYANSLFNNKSNSYKAIAIWGQNTRYSGIVNIWNDVSGKQSIVGSSTMTNIACAFYEDRLEIYAYVAGYNAYGFAVGTPSS